MKQARPASVSFEINKSDLELIKKASELLGLKNGSFARMATLQQARKQISEGKGGT